MKHHEKLPAIPGTIFFVPLVSIFLFACGGARESTRMSYDPPSIILPSNIKTIAIRRFENTTSLVDSGNKLWLATVDRFIRDGRISYVDDESKADGVIIGTIKYYQKISVSQDVNFVTSEYRLWMIMDLKFLDREKKQYLWEEPNLEQKFTYFSETQPGGKTDEQAKEELWRLFADDAVRRTLDGFGSVTSISPKAVPKTPDHE